MIYLVRCFIALAVLALLIGCGHAKILAKDCRHLGEGVFECAKTLE